MMGVVVFWATVVSTPPGNALGPKTMTWTIYCHLMKVIKLNMKISVQIGSHALWKWYTLNLKQLPSLFFILSFTDVHNQHHSKKTVCTITSMKRLFTTFQFVTLILACSSTTGFVRHAMVTGWRIHFPITRVCRSVTDG